MPAWNREERIVRRQRTVYVLSDEAKQSPGVHLRAGQRNETTCTAGSRKCFDTDAFFSIVKDKAVPALIVAALMD